MLWRLPSSHFTRTFSLWQPRHSWHMLGMTIRGVRVNPQPQTPQTPKSVNPKSEAPKPPTPKPGNVGPKSPPQQRGKSMCPRTPCHGPVGKRVRLRQQEDQYDKDSMLTDTVLRASVCQVVFQLAPQGPISLGTLREVLQLQLDADLRSQRAFINQMAQEAVEANAAVLIQSAQTDKD